jgi:hypothetical protein
MQKKSYETPHLIEYGSITELTLQTPGAFKGCGDCALDPMFGEPSHPQAS